MNLDDEIRSILFKIGQDIKVHKLQDGHLILDIDYEKYVEEFMKLFNNYPNKDWIINLEAIPTCPSITFPSTIPKNVGTDITV